MKLLVLKCSKNSIWGSCNVISSNLHKAYQALQSPFEVKWFDLPEEIVDHELKKPQSCILSLAKTIRAYNPDRIIFVDHVPVAGEVLTWLSFADRTLKIPPVVAHIYGDFTYFSKHWLLMNKHVESQEIHYICASTSQEHLFKYFQTSSQVSLSVCPFPVDRREYHYDDNLRKATREKFELKDSDFVFVYSGRISMQKNVDVVIERFLSFKKKNPDNNAKLWIMGAYDDIGARMTGYKSYLGMMFQKIRSILNKYPKDIVNDVVFHGHLNKKDQLALFCASDAFVSMSLYHDEDFGMSPAEALSTGLKSILTDWGGYSSFQSQNNDWETSLIDVAIEEEGLAINTKKLEEMFKNFSELKDTAQLRKKRSLAFLDYFSVDAVANKLPQLMAKKTENFKPFNWKYRLLDNIVNEKHTSSDFSSLLHSSNDNFYKEIYINYISKLRDNK